MTKVKYDDIIGGGGSTGCVPADRLCADNPVLVLPPDMDSSWLRSNRALPRARA